MNALIMTRSRVVAIVMMLVLAVVISSCSVRPSRGAKQASGKDKTVNQKDIKQPLKLESLSYYYCRCGMYVILARFSNPNRRIGLRSKYLSAVLFDKNNRRLLKATGYLNYIFPGQEKRVTLEADTKTPLPVDSVGVEARPAGWTVMNPVKAPQVKVIKYNWHQQGTERGYIGGKVRNDSKNLYRAVFVRGFLYGKNGKLEGIAFDPKLVLKPGETANFKAVMTSLEKVNPTPVDKVIAEADTYDDTGKGDEAEFSCAGFSVEKKQNAPEHQGHQCNLNEML